MTVCSMQVDDPRKFERQLAIGSAACFSTKFLVNRVAV